MAFDTQAYSEFAETDFTWTDIERPAVDRALTHVDYGQHTAVLDIGSGSGRVIAEHFRLGAAEQRTTAVEPESQFCDMIRSRFPEVLINGNRIQDAHIRMGHYNVVSAVMVMRYLDDNELGETLDRINRALVYGGTFVMLDAHPARIARKDGYERYFEEGERTIETPWGGSESYFYRNIDSYVNAIEESGLRVVSLDECRLDPELAETNPEKFAKYSVGPARFCIAAASV